MLVLGQGKTRETELFDPESETAFERPLSLNTLIVHFFDVQYFNVTTNKNIPKLTVGFQVDFPITDVLQMMGRAGRPQFDSEARAVVMVHEILGSCTEGS